VIMIKKVISKLKKILYKSKQDSEAANNPLNKNSEVSNNPLYRSNDE
jgi:hypothetical protein